MFSAHALREGRGGPRAHINVTTITHFGQNWCIYRLPACIVWLYYASSSTMWRFSNNFFFCLVFWSPCYTLSRKKLILIIGTLGSGWNRKFYMGAQNGSNYELWSRDFFDSRPRIKVMALWSLYRKPFTCNVCQKNFTGTRKKFYGRAAYVDDPLPNIVHIAVWVSACILWLYYASSSTVWWFSDHFFSA